MSPYQILKHISKILNIILNLDIGITTVDVTFIKSLLKITGKRGF